MDNANDNSTLPEGLTVRQVRQTDGPKGKETQVTSEPAGAKLRRVRKPGDLSTLRRRLWQAVLAAEDVLLSAATASDQTKAIHALTNAGGAYRNLLETMNLQDEMKALDARLSKLEKGGRA